MFSHTLEDDLRRQLEGDLRIVTDLIEIGMNTARILRRQAEAGDRQAMGKFPAIADAVMQSIALQTAIRTRLAKLPPKLPPKPAPRPPVSAADDPHRAQRQREQVKSLVEGAIRTDAGGARIVERRLLQLDEWLEDPALEPDLVQRTSGQIAADLCRRLGITPDISGWPQEALWEEAIREAKAREQN